MKLGLACLFNFVRSERACGFVSGRFSPSSESPIVRTSFFLACWLEHLISQCNYCTCDRLNLMVHTSPVGGMNKKSTQTWRKVLGSSTTINLSAWERHDNKCVLSPSYRVYYHYWESVNNCIYPFLVSVNNGIYRFLNWTEKLLCYGLLVMSILHGDKVPL